MVITIRANFESHVGGDEETKLCESGEEIV